VDAALGFCFEGIRLHRVTASCDSRNVAACGLFEKVGMRREGEFVKNRFSNGEWTNSIWFAALGEEYREAGVNPPPGSSA
jgi:aminoglycoside 6'-N-acetyltransferase